MTMRQGGRLDSGKDVNQTAQEGGDCAARMVRENLGAALQGVSELRVKGSYSFGCGID